MSFREFVANIHSTRDFKEVNVENKYMDEIKACLQAINSGAGQEKGFSFAVLENGFEVYKELEGVGGYSGVMIKSPHYISLALSAETLEAEFLSAYYMQSVVKKLYEFGLGSCWISVRGLKSMLSSGQPGNINYLLAFGYISDKAKHAAPHVTVINASSSHKQDPYGTKVVEASESDKARLSVGEIVYLHEWGKAATYEELENRGVADIFFYVRNAPSYKNMQPCRLILKDGEAELAVLNPQNIENYVDAGILMYTLEGLAKDMGIPCKWNFVAEEAQNKEYSITARVEL